jgi:hypothetical protein
VETLQAIRVDAYFEETKIPQIKVGSPVGIQLMDGSPALRGRVEGIACGITDFDRRDGPELLASVNPTLTWVRLAQRIPVRVRPTDIPPDVLISAGMTCTVLLQDGNEVEIAAGAKRIGSVSKPVQPCRGYACRRSVRPHGSVACSEQPRCRCSVRVCPASTRLRFAVIWKNSFSSRWSLL